MEDTEPHSKQDKNTEFRKRVGRNIEYYLALKNKSQRWLAEQTGGTNAQINKWIKGHYMPNPNNMQRIAQALDVTMATLYQHGPYGVKEEVRQNGKDHTRAEIDTGDEYLSMEAKVINMRIDEIVKSHPEQDDPYVVETKRRVEELTKLAKG